MVKLRLTRTGRKGEASYRIVAIDSRKSRDSKALEYIGHYSPHTKAFEVKEERVKYWMSVGAQPSSTVVNLLVRNGAMPKKAQIKRKFSDAPGKKSQDRAEAKAAKAEAAKAPKPEVKEEEPAEVVSEAEGEAVEEVVADEVTEEVAAEAVEEVVAEEAAAEEIAPEETQPEEVAEEEPVAEATEETK